MNRKREAEGTPFTDLALCPDSAAVALHNGLGDIETESDASSIILGRALPRDRSGGVSASGRPRTRG